MINTEDLSIQTKRFVALLEEASYYDAHEALEQIWFPLRHTPNLEVNFIRGCINAAVSFELMKRNRPHAALKPWDFYQKQRLHLSRLPAEHLRYYQRICATIDAIYFSLKEYHE